MDRWRSPAGGKATDRGDVEVKVVNVVKAVMVVKVVKAGLPDKRMDGKLKADS